MKPPLVKSLNKIGNTMLYAILGGVIAGCVSFGIVPAAYAEGAVVMAFFDLSGSTADSAQRIEDQPVRKAYLQDFFIVVDKMDDSDVLFAAPISAQTGSESFIVQETFPTHSILFSSKRNYEMKIKELRARAKGKAKKLLESDATSPSTDIFGAIRVADKVFGRYPEKKPVLIFFSDMIQASDGYSFAKRVPDENMTKKLIGEWEAKSDRPRFTNVDMYVWGAVNRDEQKRALVEKFWRQFLTGLGARVVEYSSRQIHFDKR